MVENKKPVRIKPDLSDLEGDYMDPLNGQKIHLPLADSLKLGAWDYLILIQ